jgi:hypothetical protein
MTIYVFMGPTLEPSLARSLLPATFLPPAAQGDVYRAALRDPLAIAIIDGYFDHTPAVWHKEILAALSRGVHVWGAASMGALRAAELAPFGMRGVGKIYESFAAGRLEDDDEVAVAHADASSGYRTSSDAMVDMRATFERAVQSGAIGKTTGEQLTRIAKSLFYAERSYPMVLRLAREQGLGEGELTALRGYLAAHAHSQKAEDARELLRTLADFARASPPRFVARFTLAYTDAWSRVVESTETPTE